MKKILISGYKMWNKSEPVKSFVKWCLENRPGTRGDGRLLNYFVWRYYDGIDLQNGLTIKKMRKLTNPETIRRRRAEIQNAKNEDGSWKYPDLRPTEKTQIKREGHKPSFVGLYLVSL